MNQIDVAWTAAIGGVSLWCVISWWRSGVKAAQSWRLVGTVRELCVYPLKTGAAVPLKSSWASKLGLQDHENGQMRDRCLVVADSSGKFVSGVCNRSLKLRSVTATLQDGYLKLQAPGFKELKVALSDIDKNEPMSAKRKDHVLNGVNCGVGVSRWISDVVLGDEEGGLRLMWHSPNVNPSADLRRPGLKFPLLKASDSSLYHDQGPFHAINETSMNDLRTRVPASALPIPSDQFRSSLIIETPKPYEEDNWNYVKIGNAEFRSYRKCTRCSKTTVNPGTNLKSDEPLTTLKRYRQDPDPVIAKKNNYSPNFGIDLVADVEGSIKVGDLVYARDR